MQFKWNSSQFAFKGSNNCFFFFVEVAFSTAFNILQDNITLKCALRLSPLWNMWKLYDITNRQLQFDIQSFAHCQAYSITVLKCLHVICDWNTSLVRDLFHSAVSSGPRLWCNISRRDVQPRPKVQVQCAVVVTDMMTGGSQLCHSQFTLSPARPPPLGAWR